MAEAEAGVAEVVAEAGAEAEADDVCYPASHDMHDYIHHTPAYIALHSSL